MQLLIDRELQEFITPLHEDEFEALTMNIKEYGCIEPIAVWNDGSSSMLTIVDGHHRYWICQEHNIKFKTEKLKFADKIDAITWMVIKQKGRRNLTLIERLNLHSKLKEYAAKYAKERMYAAEKCEASKLASPDASLKAKGKTMEKIAHAAGVSVATAERYDAVLRKGSAEQKEAMLSGKKKVGTVYREIHAKENKKRKGRLDGDDIEKLFKGKLIQTPHIVLYDKIDKSSGLVKNAHLTNCDAKRNFQTCRDHLMHLAEGRCPEDDFIQMQLAIRRVVESLMQKSEVLRAEK